MAVDASIGCRPGYWLSVSQLVANRRLHRLCIAHRINQYSVNHCLQDQSSVDCHSIGSVWAVYWWNVDHLLLKYQWLISQQLTDYLLIIYLFYFIYCPCPINPHQVHTEFWRLKSLYFYHFDGEKPQNNKNWQWLRLCIRQVLVICQWSIGDPSVMYQRCKDQTSIDYQLINCSCRASGVYWWTAHNSLATGLPTVGWRIGRCLGWGPIVVSSCCVGGHPL